MKISKLGDWRRMSKLFNVGTLLAKLVQAGLNTKAAVSMALPGTGNVRSGQTVFKAKTQAGEIARRKRQCVQPTRYIIIRPHSGKPAPGTPMPLPKRTLEQYLFGFIHFSDGTRMSEEEYLEHGVKGRRFGIPRPYTGPRRSKGNLDRATRRYYQDERTGAVRRVTQFTDKAA